MVAAAVEDGIDIVHGWHRQGQGPGPGMVGIGDDQDQGPGIGDRGGQGPGGLDNNLPRGPWRVLAAAKKNGWHQWQQQWQRQRPGKG